MRLNLSLDRKSAVAVQATAPIFVSLCLLSQLACDPTPPPAGETQGTPGVGESADQLESSESGWASSTGLPSTTTGTGTSSSTASWTGGSADSQTSEADTGGEDSAESIGSEGDDGADDNSDAADSGANDEAEDSAADSAGDDSGDDGASSEEADAGGDDASGDDASGDDASSSDEGSSAEEDSSDSGADTDNQICEPGKRKCDGQIIVECNADGSDWDDVKQCEAPEVCNPVTASCSALMCEPNSFFCRDGHPRRCDPDGLASHRVDECTPAEFCRDGHDACFPRICEPGAPGCAGNRASVCNAEGSGMEPGGEDCERKDPPGICYAGSCLVEECPARAYVCSNGDVHRCNDDGMTHELVNECGWEEYCDNGLSTCAKGSCAPGQPLCTVDQRATFCRADATGPMSGGVDCAAMGKSCVDGACEFAWRDNFEDRRIDGWKLVNEEYGTLKISGAVEGAQDTRYAVYVGERANAPAKPSLRRALSGDLRPRAMRWSAQVTQHMSGLGEVRLRDTAGKDVIYVRLGNGIEVGSRSAGGFYADRWYDLELIFDWSAREVEIAVDGNRVNGRFEFTGEGEGIHEIILWGGYRGGSYFDEFEMVP